MKRIHGYQLGIFISEADRCLERGDMLGIIKTVEKHLDNLREVEKAIFEDLKERDGHGEAAV